MRKTIPKIKEFPNDGRIWRVDWFGGVERNDLVPSEPKIQLIISPIVSGTGSDYAASKAVNHDERQTISIGVGQLPLITIGSLWKNQRCLHNAAGKIHDFSNIEISPSTVRLIKSDLVVGDHPLIPKSHHQIGMGLAAKCLVVEFNGDPYGVIIPVVEIIRFYYATSTDLAKAIFYGDFQHNLGSIVNPAECGFNPDDRQCILKLRKEFSDPDAYIIGRILFSEYARAGAKLVHDSLMKDAALGKARAYPEVAFPFTGLTSLRARIRFIPTSEKGVWRFLVFALEHCTGQFPFNSILCDRDNNNIRPSGDDRPDDEKEAAYSTAKPQSKPEVVDGELQSEEEPSNDIQQVVLVLPEDRFGALADIPLEKPIKDICHYFNAGTVYPQFEPTDVFGTGDGTYSENDTTAFAIESENIRQAPLPASFEVFQEMVTLLNEQYKLYATIRVATQAIKFVPLTESYHKRQWSYLDSDLKKRRVVAIADIEHRSRNYHLVEFEWRQGESFRLALIYLPNGARINDDMMRLILVAMARTKGRWENLVPFSVPVVLRTLKHTWPSIESYVNAVMERITDINNASVR